MTTGLFVNTTPGKGLNFKTRKRASGPPSWREDQIADLMAEGLDNIQIRERLGMRAAQVTGYVARIRARLGWQAQ